MKPKRQIYLDHSATTPVDKRVATVMFGCLTETFGNPSSVHGQGQKARAAVDRARREVASLLGARQNEIVFVSGGTEANNLAIRGICHDGVTNRHVITSQIEHPSARSVIEALEKNGWDVTWLPVYDNGVVKVEDVRSALRPETTLVSVMLANNEIGTVQPIQEIGDLVRSHRQDGHNKIWFHSDAVQGAGRIPLDVEKLGCDLMSVSGHKLYAPKGVGALYARKGVRLHPQNIGGHQERERRAGTENVPGIVAFGEAARLAKHELSERTNHDARLRDRFESEIQRRIEDVVLNGDRLKRLPHLSNISFRFIEGEGLLINLDLQGVEVSTGSACSSGTLEPSPVIRALGHANELARGSIRFSFGKDNSDEDVDYAIDVLVDCVARLRELSPLNKQRELQTSSLA